MLVGIEEDIVGAEETYHKQKEELRDLSQKTNKRVSDKTTNVLDRLASFDDGVAGFFGGILEGLGLAEGLTGEAKKTLLLGEAQEEKKELENRLFELESMKVNEHLKAGPGSASHKKAMIARTKKQLDEQQKIIDAQESGAAQEKELQKLIKKLLIIKKKLQPVTYVLDS